MKKYKYKYKYKIKIKIKNENEREKMEERRQNIRCCSFCYDPGHSVNRCSHILLSRFASTCAVNRILFDYQFTNNSQSKFTEWLIHHNMTYPRLVKAFASRFCQVPMKCGMNERINRITRYIYGLSYSFIMNGVNPHNNYLITLALTNYPVLINMNYQERIQYIRGLENIVELLEFEEPNNNVLHKLPLSIQMVNDDTACINTTTTISECSICYDETPENKYVHLNCNHSFCGNCVLNMIKKRTGHQDHIKCGLCREIVQHVTIKDSEIMSEITNYITPVV